MKGHSFSCAAETLYFCHSERTLVREEPAYESFSATCWIRTTSLNSVADATSKTKASFLSSAREYTEHWRSSRVLLVLFVLTLPLVNPWVRGDGVGYYAYVRSLLVEHKLDFQDDWRNANPSFSLGRVHPDGTIDPRQYTPTGRLNNHFAVGPSILWAPFVAPVHLSLSLLHKLGAQVKPDGFSKPYIVTMALATALYGFLGLYLSFRFARQFVEERWALLATIGIWFASSLPVYMYFNPSWSHAHSAFVVAAFVLYWHLTRPQRSSWQWLVLGLISGLMLDVYYANVVLLLFPALESLKAYWCGWRASAHDLPVLKRLLGANLIFITATLVAFTPTLITKHLIYGHALDLGYSGVIHWASPRFARVLFSSDHGLLSWTPIIILALVGLVLLHRFDPELSIYSLSAFIVLWYLIACDSSWDGLSSFGNRFFISLTPLFVLGLAVLFSESAKRFTKVRFAHLPFVVMSAVTSLFIIWNLAFIFQWGDHLIPVRGPISWRQMASNQIRVVPSECMRQLHAYFSRRDSLMQEIEKKDLHQLEHGSH